jgi:hypothetical protein
VGGFYLSRRGLFKYKGFINIKGFYLSVRGLFYLSIKVLLLYTDFI